MTFPKHMPSSSKTRQSIFLDKMTLNVCLLILGEVSICTYINITRCVALRHVLYQRRILFSLTHTTKYNQRLSLCCLMTSGLSKNIWCHVWPYYFLFLHIIRSDIRSHVKWAISMVIVDDHLIFLRVFCAYVWVNIFILSPPTAQT